MRIMWYPPSDYRVAPCRAALPTRPAISCGAGFVDNFIMVMAGDAIDRSLGVAFGLTAMAAAGLGNACSDVCGVYLGGTIEAFAGKLGIPDPKLSAAQAASRPVVQGPTQSKRNP